MRFRASAIVLALGALGATPCLALTIQAAPPPPDVAQHLRSTTPAGPGVLPAAKDLQGSFVAPGRPQLGQGYTASPTTGTTSFSFGSLHGTTTVTRGDAFWNDSRRRDEENPLSLTPSRR